jgi:hypothetical protein
MSARDSLRKLHYEDWKAQEEESRARYGEFWVPQVVQKMPDGGHIELDKDNKAYYVGVNGVRKRIKEL